MKALARFRAWFVGPPMPARYMGEHYTGSGWHIVYPECVKCGHTVRPRGDGTWTPCACDPSADMIGRLSAWQRANKAGDQ
jgi:hypothetical protein